MRTNRTPSQCCPFSSMTSTITSAMQEFVCVSSVVTIIVSFWTWEIFTCYSFVSRSSHLTNQQSRVVSRGRGLAVKTLVLRQCRPPEAERRSLGNSRLRPAPRLHLCSAAHGTHAGSKFQQ